MFPEVQQTEIDDERIAGFTTEWDHMSVAVDLLREVASYACIAACIMGEQPTWSRDQAMVGGHAVRLYKLLLALLDQICQRRRETADILLRLVFETGVNVRFLIQEWSPDLADSYIRASLRHERKLRDTIEGNIAGRNGEILPIEKRMLDSIDRTARIAGVPLDSVDLKQRAPFGGKHLAQKAKDVGWMEAYDAFFGGLSHNVHGSWQDLYTHHLETNGDGCFAPDLDWSRPRPQPLFAVGTLTVQVVADVAQFLGGETALDRLSPLLENLHGRIAKADALHEKYLQSKRWPEA
jgi:hypothetical protein